MPEFKKMDKEEVEALTTKPEKKPSEREQTRQEYKEYLEQFKPGDWVKVNLKEGENRQTVKNRLMRAAKDLGYKLNFQGTRGPLRFEVQKTE